MYQLTAFSIEVPQDPRKTLVTTIAQFEDMARQLEGQRVRIFDHETSGLAWYRHSRSCGLGLGYFDGEGVRSFYVPYRHHTGEAQLDIERISPVIRRWFADPLVTWIAHNLKFDDHMNRREGWKIGGSRYCTQMAARIYNENDLLALKKRAHSDLGIAEAALWGDRLDKEILRLAKSRRMGKTQYRELYGYSEVSITLAGYYACHDIEYTGLLYRLYEAWGLSRNYPRIWSGEMALNGVLTDMEEWGMPIDVPYLEGLRDRLVLVESTLGTELAKALGDSYFNPGSDAEVRDLLFNRLGQCPVKFTDHNEPSVDKDVLAQLQHIHPAIGVLKRWREANKIRTTWTGSILNQLDDRGILHGSLKPDGTNTGRLSSVSPNLHNFAHDDPDRKKANGGVDPWSVRRAFRMRREGALRYVRFYFDYSQVELRVLTHYTQEPNMLDAYRTGQDVHRRTQLEIAQLVGTEPVRRVAKIINFGLVYCMHAGGLARQAKIPEDEAKRFLDAFFAKYSGITGYRDRFWAQCRQQGNRFTNMFGRTRTLADLSSSDYKARGRAQRQLFGSLIQGTAAQLTKESLVRIHAWIKKTGSGARLVSTVHDDIWTDCPVGEMVTVARAKKALMEDYPEFAPIPILVDGKYSTDNWAESKSLPL